jgi:asparagine synthase (glutamine-hydrolysing)
MTALAARWNFGGRPDAEESCQRMLTAQRMYGPHGSACWSDGRVALGSCRDDLLPEDRFDRQPLTGGGGRFAVVADLRLDNREELREALGIDRAEAAALADSAFLLRAWERWGEECHQRLAGDYAFALWDSRDRQLFLARDHVGGRPLHYHLTPSFIAVASMPKGLHALAEIPRAADEVRAAEFLALMPETGPRSFFEGVSRVEAGKMVVVADGKVRIVDHWQPKPALLRLSGPAEYAEGLRAHLDDAVRARLRGAENRVGAHLSGGLDSPAVAATAARLMAPDGQVVAFTSAPRADYAGHIPPNRIGDETALAAATAALYPNMQHVVTRPGSRTMLDDLDRDYFLFDRPLLNIDIQHWWNAINAAAQQRGVGVMLTALMGNVTLSYDGLELLPELAAQLRLSTLWKTARAVRRKTAMRWRGALVQSFGPWLPDWLWIALNRARQGWYPDLNAYSMLSAERARSLDIQQRAKEKSTDILYRPRRNALEARLWILGRNDFGNNQKGVLAGWGVDLRDPTADKRLIEYCLSVPLEIYLRDGSPRSLARDALADRLPHQVLSEQKRGMQSIDWHEGLSSAHAQLRDEVARLEGVPEARTALDLARMRALVENWPTGGWNTPQVDMPYRQGLIRGVASGHFLRKASGRNT